MINKLRANYRLSNVLVRIACVLAYVLYSWQTSLAVASMMMAQASAQYSVVVALLTSALLGMVVMLLVPLISNLFLTYSRFYTVPRAEFALLTMLFFTLYFVVCGLLKLVNLFTPLLIVWGDVIFPVLVSLGCVIGFYAATAKLYFNNQTKPYYFRSLAVAYLILIVIAEVLL